MRNLLKLALIATALIPLAARAEGFLWRTESISATVRRDPVTPRLGQFLRLEQKLEPGETGWGMMKIDLPENWSVKEVIVAAGKVTLRLEDGSRYELTEKNVSALQFEILDSGARSDSALDELWRKHAHVKD